MASQPYPETEPVSSDYVRRRAADPIAWQPWADATFAAAAERDLPVLLSIGYGGGAWCEKMAAESFADPQLATLINRRFVPVCVDRDRRPDVDRVYQNAFRLLNGRPGGWPLTAVLTADDRLPFFAASYIAREPRGGLPGLAELLARLADLYRDNPARVREQNAGLSGALQAGPSRHGASGYSLRPALLETAVEAAKQRFDTRHGGFTADGAPKTPQLPLLERLLRHYQHSRQNSGAEADTRAAFMVKFSLEKIAASPLKAADGGFYRYATQADWSEPQREQPLAENAALLALYAQTFRLSGSDGCRRAAAELAGWLTALASPAGDFYGGRIDSDGHPGNDRQPLLARPRPAGNGVAIKALALAGRLLPDPALVTAAERALDAQRGLWRGGRLRSTAVVCLDDYVYLLDGVLELLQCRWQQADFELAVGLAEAVLKHYQGARKKGGFFFTAGDHEALIQRPPSQFDDALPAPGGLAAQLLIRLGHWRNDIRYLLAAERALKNAWPVLERNPLGCCGMLLGLEEYFFPPQTVVLRGPPTALAEWRTRILDRDDTMPASRRTVLAIPADQTPPAELLAACQAAGERPLGYICNGNKRSPPYTELRTLRLGLRAVPPAGG